MAGSGRPLRRHTTLLKQDVLDGTFTNALVSVELDERSQSNDHMPTD